MVSPRATVRMNHLLQELDAHRRASSMSWSELANAMDIPLSSLNNWRSGKSRKPAGANYVKLRRYLKRINYQPPQELGPAVPPIVVEQGMEVSYLVSVCTPTGSSGTVPSVSGIIETLEKAYGVGHVRVARVREGETPEAAVEDVMRPVRQLLGSLVREELHKVLGNGIRLSVEN